MGAKVVGIIPARYGSTRLPAKALAQVAGQPLIQRVYEHAKQARVLEEVWVATDDARIMDAVARFGGKAVMTSPSHQSGTDRIAEVARQLDAQVILNIQGDEPLMHPEPINAIAEFLLAHQAVPMATVMTTLMRPEDATNPHVVKVVVDQDGYALYFSRAPIPHIRIIAQGSGEKRSGLGAEGSGQLLHPEPPTQSPQLYWKHLGLYGYQREFLLRFPQLTRTPLEQAESLEQLRALEHGYRIRVLETTHDSIGVDTADDLQRVEKLLSGERCRV